MSLFGLVGGNATIDIFFDNLDGRKNVPVKDKDGSIVKLPLFQGEDDISGKCEISIGNSKKFEHTGIRVELIGKIGKKSVYEITGLIPHRILCRCQTIQ